MPTFRVELEGGCQDGEVLWVEAPTEAEALTQVLAVLQQRGLTPLTVTQRASREAQDGEFS